MTFKGQCREFLEKGFFMDLMDFCSRTLASNKVIFCYGLDTSCCFRDLVRF
jgi:hypothetical protein